MTISIIRFINIYTAALPTGVSFGIWIGFNPLNLSPSTYVEQQQNMIQSLNLLLFSLAILVTLITLVSAFLQKGNKQVFISLIAAALFFIACIVISAFGNQPINNIVMTWTPDTLPENWVSLRDKWWSLHIMRTITELIALCLITWASIRKD
jgi:uncharacterized membrane protein